MRCTVCKKEDGEVKLFEGILNTDMVMICEDCSEIEGIPIIKKPSEKQLERSEKRYSVRERMERLSGMRKTTEISEEQTIFQGNLAKLRVPSKKETHPDVFDNYYWELNMARRRRKISPKQLGEMVGLDEYIIEAIEKGIIPDNFEEVFLKIESFLGIKLLKHHRDTISFKRTVDEEKALLEEVKRRMESPGTEEEFEIKDYSKLKAKKEDYEDVTLNDLVELKRRRDKEKFQKKVKIQTESMIGDDIDLDIDEI